jgi:hypothetical protein
VTDFLAALKKRISERPFSSETPKQSQPAFEGFEGAYGVGVTGHASNHSESFEGFEGDLPASVLRTQATPFAGFIGSEFKFLSLLEEKVTEHRSAEISSDIKDFLKEWGDQAAGLGWTDTDLFGLHPAAPLARFDCMGLVYLINGEEVTALDAEKAMIRTPNGSLLSFRKEKHTYPTHLHNPQNTAERASGPSSSNSPGISADRFPQSRLSG